MMDATILSKLAVSYQIDEFSLLREYLQIRFLDTFYKQNNLKVYFKGGTALRLIYESTRFSEDLDFTSVEEKSEVLKSVEKVVKELATEFSGISFKETKSLQGYTGKLYLPTTLSKQKLTVRLDFSMREDVLTPIASPIETKLPTKTTALIDHISDKEILAEKVRAILKRDKGRDYFDLWFLLSSGVRLDNKLINAKMNYYGEKYSPNSLKIKINELDVKSLEADLRRFLPIAQRRIIKELKRLLLAKLGK